MSEVYAKSEGVTLVGGGVVSVKTLENALKHAPWLVAADGGADQAVALGHQPDVVIGDLDSLSDSLRTTLGATRLRHIATQDNTDFDKAINLIEAPFVLAVGFSGGRLDHTLAAMNTLLRNPARRLIIATGADVCVLLPPQLDLSLPVGTRVSLFPMGSVTCTSEGLHWPVAGLAFDPRGTIGTSNITTHATTRLTCTAPSMLLLLPETALDPLLNALRAVPLWPQTARAR